MTELEILQKIEQNTWEIFSDTGFLSTTIEAIRQQMILVMYSNAMLFGLLTVCTVFIVVGFIKRRRN